MEEEKKPNTSLELLKIWNDFGCIFSKSLESNTIGIALSLLAYLPSLSEVSSVIEIGCCSGLLIPLIIAMKTKSCHYTGVDLSENLLNLADLRIKELRKDFNEVMGFWKESPFKENKEDHSKREPIEFHYPDFNITLKNLNCEDLCGIMEESQELYFASSVLHIIENPEKMIAEAYRVLKKGGKAGFSVWGNPEKSTFFTIINKTALKFGYNVEEKRSGFHLCDPKKVIKLLEDAGFSNIMFWNQFYGYNFTNFEDYYQNRLTSLTKIHLKMSDNEIKRMKDEIKDQFYYSINKGIPIGLDVLFAIGTK